MKRDPPSESLENLHSYVLGTSEATEESQSKNDNCTTRSATRATLPEIAEQNSGESESSEKINPNASSADEHVKKFKSVMKGAMDDAAGTFTRMLSAAHIRPVMNYQFQLLAF